MTTAERGQFITCRIHKGISNALQRHTTIEDINYIISGTGKAICNGTVKNLTAGGYYTFQKDSDYSFINTGDEDLVFLSYIKEE